MSVIKNEAGFRGRQWESDLTGQQYATKKEAKAAEAQVTGFEEIAVDHRCRKDGVLTGATSHLSRSIHALVGDKTAEIRCLNCGYSSTAATIIEDARVALSVAFGVKL